MTAAAPPAARSGVDFGLVELDLLATHAGRRFPYPLRVPEFGRIAGERDVLLAAAGVTLRSRGLAGERGPLGVAAEVVTALAEHRGAIDLVLTRPDGAVGVVALVYRSWTLVCSQPLSGDPATGVRVRRVAQSALVDELMRLVPEVEAAVTMPITIPPDRSDRAALDELGVVLPELTGAGQAGATRGARRTPTDLSWLDGPRGRVRVDRAEDGWTSVNPLRRQDLSQELTTMAMAVRREHDGR
ncbi:ESX secretion-associated protein EspG [Actinokineospora pegani]|uniref:ESX secretion-associated protein EspG n=1 Tax=Actinokineospora pegani TaxID=2654637 RepID=UPI0012EA5B70|nr:ESX secretion-associated protein EspG [Actinokineospora pegani]